MDGFTKFHFKDFGQNEKIIRVIHRNWFYLFEQFFWMLVIAGVFIGGINFLPAFSPEIFKNVNNSVPLFAQNFFMLAIWLYGFMIWIDYYFDIWVITSERIINIEQKGMFSRKASELRFQKIQDITTEVTGFLPTVFNYGDVRIQTAGTTEEFVFRTISDPYNIKNIVMKMQKTNEENSTDRIGEMLKEKIEE